MSGFTGAGDGENLIDVEKRKKEADWVLGDPLLFPLEFINWLKRYIEQSGIQLPASQIFGLPGGGSGAGDLKNYPPGLILPFAGPIAPAGALAADGQLVNKEDYPVLWAQLGDTWGVSTDTQFYLPDLRDRALYGAGPQMPVGMTDTRAIGARGPWHHHTFNVNTDNKGAHSHGGGVSGDGAHGHSGDTTAGGNHDHAPGDGRGFATSVANTYIVDSSSGSARYLINNVQFSTSLSGDHAHHIDLGGGGHGHGISSDGGHVHAVAGNTSGAGQVDVGGFAAILYVITTG